MTASILSVGVGMSARDCAVIICLWNNSGSWGDVKDCLCVCVYEGGFVCHIFLCGGCACGNHYSFAQRVPSLFWSQHSVYPRCDGY